MNPLLDLVLEVELKIPLARAWEGWTQAALLKQWLCPRPWQISECEVDLRPGGILRFAMQGPEGEHSEHVCCWLEVLPMQRLVWTNSLLPGFRPAPVSVEVPQFTALIEFEARGEHTLYRATAMHRDAHGCAQHAAMGFQEGWGICAQQLQDLQAGR